MSTMPPFYVTALLAALLLSACASPPRPQATPETATGMTTGGQPDTPPALTAARTLSAATPPATASQTGTPPAAPPENNRIYFASGSADIDPAGEAKLRQHAERLRADSDLVVLIVGHTDPAGSRSYNLAVADRRTAAVARLLQGQGVARTQIRRQNVGSTPSMPLCRTPDCQKLMRRVDLVYTD